MSLIVVGCSHKTSAVEIREKLAFAAGDVEGCLHSLAGLPGVAEGVIVSTCNRVEIDAVAADPAQGVEEVRRYFITRRGHDVESMTPYLYAFTDESAVAHLFKVTASLDSM